MILHLLHWIVEMVQPHYSYLYLIIPILYNIFNILILIVLWTIIVKVYQQIKFSNILKTIIVLSTVIASLSLIFDFHKVQLILIALIVFLLLNTIFYFIFIFRIMDVDNSEIRHVNQLKNYGVAFVICLFLQFILNLVTEIGRNKDLIDLKHLLAIVPMVFLVLFFRKTKNGIL